MNHDNGSRDKNVQQETVHAASGEEGAVMTAVMMDDEPPPSQDYGYEDFAPDIRSSGHVSSNRQVRRRNVVKASENVYDLSYHPGRVVCMFT